MRVYYALEALVLVRLCLRLACFGASACGWLAGAWPFGVIEGLCSVSVLRR
jgi:hypothetical protein